MCDAPLIRTSIDDGGRSYFVAGLIHCLGKTPGHEKKAWLEVWPNANMILSKEKRLELPPDKYIHNFFRLSDPRIRESYTPLGVALHESHLILSIEGKLPLPKETPIYCHEPLKYSRE